MRTSSHVLSQTALAIVFFHARLVEMATDHYLQPGYNFGDEFEWGLNLILDALSGRVRG